MNLTRYGVGHGREDRKGLITTGGRRKELPAYLPQVLCALWVVCTSGSCCLLEHCRQLLKLAAGAVLHVGCVRRQLDVWVREATAQRDLRKEGGALNNQTQLCWVYVSMFWVRLYPVDGLIHIGLSI
jgi:hypothetical protein